MALTRVIKLLGSAGVWLADQSISLAQMALKKKPKATCVVLYYHTVSPDHRMRFRSQMDILLKHCVPVSTKGISNLRPSVRHVAVTFDDGFRTVIENAIPELRARDIPVTIFVPPACLGKSPSWPGVEEDLETHEIVADLHELRQLKESQLVSIQSHCLTHSDLCRLDAKDAKHEIIQSKTLIEHGLKEKVESLSFPFGSFDSSHIEYARNAGYSRVFSTIPVRIRENDADRFVIGRVKVEPTDWTVEFYLKLLGAYRWLPFAFAVKRKLRKLFAQCLSGLIW
jgi:peptidoglycan/xylan/chitin deacetylase (PgdA/CDA1 family)